MSALDRLERPLIQGGMGIGVSMGNLAGAVAAEGAMGVISTANIGFTEEDFGKLLTTRQNVPLEEKYEKQKTFQRAKAFWPSTPWW